MPQRYIGTTQSLPSSILHNSTELRRQHIRAASKRAARFISLKVRSLHRKVDIVNPDMTQIQGGH